MDRWGWDQLQPWLEIRARLPVGALLCVIRAATAGRHWEPSAARKQLRRTAALAGVRRRFAPHQLRHAHAVEMAQPAWRANSRPGDPAGRQQTARSPRVRARSGTVAIGTELPCRYARAGVWTDAEPGLSGYRGFRVVTVIRSPTRGHVRDANAVCRPSVSADSPVPARGVGLAVWRADAGAKRLP
jgi:hypothetical protein